MNMHIPSRQNIFREMRDYLMIALGMIMYGIGWTVFLLPNDITTGGVPGIASLVYFATGLPVFRHQLPTVIACYPYFRMEVQHQDNFCRFYPDFLSANHSATDRRRSPTERPAFHGMCHRSIFLWRRHRHCFLFERKYGDITLGRVMLFCDLIIISSSYFVLKDWEKVVYGYVTLYICSFVLDQVVNSARQSVQFFIISEKYEEIARHINVYPHRGATVINASGFYTGKEIKMLFVLAKKRESTIIFRLIKDIDPNAFVSQSQVIGVYGEGFDKIKVK